MQEDLGCSLERTNRRRRTKINTTKMNQRKSTRRNSKTIPRKIAQSFATIVKNLVMSNKTATFPRNILNTQMKVKEKQWQPLGVTLMSQARKKMRK